MDTLYDSPSEYLTLSRTPLPCLVALQPLHGRLCFDMTVVSLRHEQVQDIKTSMIQSRMRCDMILGPARSPRCLGVACRRPQRSCLRWPDRSRDTGEKTWRHRTDTCFGKKGVAVAVAVPMMGDVGDPPSWHLDSRTTSRIFWVACSAAVMAAVSRTCFSMLAIPIQRDFGLSMGDMGLIQSSLLFGYIVGQIPAGVLSDRIGGIKALLFGLFVWSLFGVLMMGIPLASSPILALLALRSGLGLGQSVLMPGISATAAQSFAPTERGDKTSGIYACYSLGTVFGLIITPILADVAGWLGCLGIFGILGIICCVSGSFLLHQDAMDSAPDIVTKPAHNKPHFGRFRRHAKHLVLLCWTHAVIGFGFFVLQSWIPTFLHGLGITNLKSLGLISALPWLLTAFVSVFSGRISMYLESERDWSFLRVRRLMQTLSSIGIASCLLPLAALNQHAISPLLAIFTISMAVAFQGLCYPGFHSYVQDIAAKDAGLVLALTNSCSIAAGIFGNIITGHLAASPYGFRAVFGLTAILYVLSALTWLIFTKGTAMELTNETSSP